MISFVIVPDEEDEPPIVQHPDAWVREIIDDTNLARFIYEQERSRDETPDEDAD